MNINKISPINFGKRVRIASDENSAKIKHVSNASAGVTSLASAASSAMDVASVSGALLELPSCPLGMVASSFVSPKVALNVLSDAPYVLPLLTGAESVSSVALCGAGQKIIDKEFPTDEEDNGNNDII